MKNLPDSSTPVSGNGPKNEEKRYCFGHPAKQAEARSEGTLRDIFTAQAQLYYRAQETTRKVTMLPNEGEDRTRVWVRHLREEAEGQES
jgi:hypothetical protein